MTPIKETARSEDVLLVQTQGRVERIRVFLGPNEREVETLLLEKPLGHARYIFGSH